VGFASHKEEWLAIVEAYREAGQTWPATTRQMAEWAFQNNLWRPTHDSLLTQLADNLSKALREDYLIDPQGRSVRAKHAARVRRDGEQMVLWADMRDAPREHMEIAFQQRRQQIVGDCRQLKTDVDSYNENAELIRPIQMVFDFTDDLEELEIMELLRQEPVFA